MLWEVGFVCWLIKCYFLIFSSILSTEKLLILLKLQIIFLFVLVMSQLKITFRLIITLAIFLHVSFILISVHDCYVVELFK